jgi:hypothetical protein
LVLLRLAHVGCVGKSYDSTETLVLCILYSLYTYMDTCSNLSGLASAIFMTPLQSYYPPISSRAVKKNSLQMPQIPLFLERKLLIDKKKRSGFPAREQSPLWNT